MENGKERLTALLDYLIEHNGEHSEELTGLAERAKTVANDIVRDDLREAARLMNDSSEHLKHAVMELSKEKNR
jgi:hypothetical protein